MFKRLIVTCGGLLLLALLAGGCANSEDAPPEATPVPTTAPTAAPTATSMPAAATPIAVPTRLMVGKTDGAGVLFRRAPGSDSEVIQGWVDGTIMLVIGEDQHADGRDWKNVKDPAGNEGWVAAEFLIVPPMPTAGPPPATPTP